jgi:hypothetical protein
MSSRDANSGLVAQQASVPVADATAPPPWRGSDPRDCDPVADATGARVVDLCGLGLLAGLGEVCSCSLWSPSLLGGGPGGCSSMSALESGGEEGVCGPVGDGEGLFGLEATDVA